MSRARIVGRFLKNGSTEYRARGRKAWLRSGGDGTSVVSEIGTVGIWEGTYPTRKAAIERIEQLLCGGVTV